MNVGDFIRKSKALAGVKGYYVKAEDFIKVYPKLDDIERKSLVLHYIMDNSPFAFSEVYERPLLFEQIRQYIAYILDVNINNVKLIGSTKVGFKMDSKNYGMPYSMSSDLDFMIIDEILFGKLAKEFYTWKSAYLDRNEMQPNGDYEKQCWECNINKLPQNIEYGFIDTYKIPNRPNILPMTQRVNNSMSLIVQKLKSIHGFQTKRASMRVYKDIDSFYCQQCRNIESILRGCEDVI